MKGKVLKYISDKGYGFLRGDDGHDYFFHKSEIPNANRANLTQGQNVEFKSSSNDRGLLALRVKPYEFVSFTTEKKVHSLKKNPFTPQDPVYNPDKFAGREVAVVNAVDSLFNGKNVLISGHRGVGKSSLAIQLINALKGDNRLLKKLSINTGSFQFNFLTSDHRCTDANSLEDIASSLLTGLIGNLGLTSRVTEVSTEWQINLKILKLREKTGKEKIDYTDLSTQFASDIMKVRQIAIDRGLNGLCMLIDEVDILEDKIQIAPFLKATVEKLRQDGIADICFLVAGVTGIATRLISEHKSSMRLFEACPLEPMNHDDITELLKITLDGTDTEIVQNAISAIADTSKNFPQPVQLLGYHSFKLDENCVIDVDDVDKAKQFIIENIRGQEFRRILNELSKDEAVIIKEAAKAYRATFNIGFLLSRTSLDELTVANSIAKLKKNGIFETTYNDAHAFVDPFFRYFVKWDIGYD